MFNMMLLQERFEHLVSLFQLQLMKKLRESIAEDRLNLAYWKKDIVSFNFSRFPAFVQDFFNKLFPALDSPAWAREALASVGVLLPS